MVSASCMWSRSHRVGSSMTRVRGLRAGHRAAASARSGAGRRRPGPTSAAVPPVSAEQLVVGGGEDGVRVPGGRPDLLVARQLDVDEGADRLGVADRGDAADGLAGVPADELRGGAGDRRDAEQRGDLRLVDPVGAAGEHEQRVAADVEDQAVGDRAHRRRRAGPRPRRRCGRCRAGGAPRRRRRPRASSRATSATRGCSRAAVMRLILPPAPAACAARRRPRRDAPVRHGGPS